MSTQPGFIKHYLIVFILIMLLGCANTNTSGRGFWDGFAYGPGRQQPQGYSQNNDQAVRQLEEINRQLNQMRRELAIPRIQQQWQQPQPKPTEFAFPLLPPERRGWQIAPQPEY